MPNKKTTKQFSNQAAIQSKEDIESTIKREEFILTRIEFPERKSGEEDLLGIGSARVGGYLYAGDALLTAHLTRVSGALDLKSTVLIQGWGREH